jgi:membrane-bound lytic murein transglycosylase D
MNEALIKLRFQIMKAPFAPVYNQDVAAYLRRYLTYGYRDTERMLGRSAMYFPIFEHYLEMHGLPEELKYLPMIESSLIPYATSVSGASGLWQFMPTTGQHLGLSIDSYLDERRDPYRSTEAAVKYLKKLHQRFGKWDLALAAYNCGPTRLSRVIRDTGSEDFWKIKRYLPRETQRYVCRYLAACYIGTYHHLHGLNPKTPEELQYNGMAAKVYEPVSLNEVSKMTGVELAVLRQLNPSFKQNYIPEKKDGIYLVLPRESWYDYLENQRDGVLAARP